MSPLAQPVPSLFPILASLSLILTSLSPLALASLSPLAGLGCAHSSKHHELGSKLPTVFSAEWIHRNGDRADPIGGFPVRPSRGIRRLGSRGVPLPGGSRMGGSGVFHAGQ